MYRTTAISIAAALGLCMSAASPALGKSNAEIALNYWGEDWSNATDLPSQLNYIGGIGCYRKPVFGTDEYLTTAQENFLDAITDDFVFQACADVIPETTTGGTKLLNHIADYHAARPNGKFIGYLDMTAIGEFQTSFPGYAEIMTFGQQPASADHRNWFVYREGCNGTGTPAWPACDFPDDVARYFHANEKKLILDISKSELLNTVANKVAEEMADLDMDGVLVDHVMQHPPALTPCDFIHDVSIRAYASGDNQQTCTASTNPPTYNAKWNNWDGNWDEFFSKLQIQIAAETGHTDMTVYANVPRDEGFVATAILPDIDGVMVEDFAARTDGTNTCPNDAGAQGAAHGFFCRMKEIITLKAAAIAAGKPLLLTAETKINKKTPQSGNASWCGGPPGDPRWDVGPGTTSSQCASSADLDPTTSADQHLYMRFYLAAYYIMQTGNEKWKFDHPSATSDQYGSMPWYYQFDCDLGAAVDAPLLMTAGVFNDTGGTADSYVFKREYEYARVWLNTTDTPDPVVIPALGYNLWNQQGTLYPGTSPINIPKDSGLILYENTGRCP